MKEELKFVYSRDKTVRFLLEKTDEKIPNFTYQPERLNPEDTNFSKLKKFKEAELIGCLNDSNITSINYKEKILESVCDSPNCDNK